MENSRPLSIESFSYSWLVNPKASLESLDSSSLRASFDASDEASSFIEMDPRMPPSKRFFCKKNSKDFKFDFPAYDSVLTVVHADELFSDGYLIPFSEKMDMQKCSKTCADSNLHPASSSSSSSSSCSSSSSLAKKKSSLPASRSCSLRRCRELSKRFLQRYLDFLMPLYRRLRGQSKSSSPSKAENIEKIDKRVHSLQTVRSWMHSSEASPRISVAYSADDEWRRSCDSESSIYEAVLHCKRSIEK